MIQLRISTLISLLVLGFSLSGPVQAEVFMVSGKVNRTLNSRSHGGCGVQLTPIIDVTKNCGDKGWVSLDCDGTHNSQAHAQGMYTTGLTAFALRKRVAIWVDNTQTHDGHCVAQRLDMLIN